MRYLQNFDVAVDYPFRSGFDVDNKEHKTLSSWYASALLKLRGFYFPEQDGDLRLVLLSLNRPATVVGYAAHQGALFRFDEAASGDHEVITATCPALPEFENLRFRQLYPQASIAVLDLPQSNPRPPAVIVTVLAPRASPEPAGLLRRSCSEVGRVPGRLAAVAQDGLVAALRHTDTPIHFYRQVESLPGFSGVGIPANVVPPAGVVPLPGVVDLAELGPAHPTAKIEKGSRILVTTPAALGEFGVQLPLHGEGKLPFPRWAQFRLRVVSGRIGLGAINHDGAMLARSGLLLPSPQPLDVALKTPPGTAYVVLFNNENRGASQVEMLDATAVASPADALTYRRMLETEGVSNALGVPRELQPPPHSLRLDPILKLAEAQPSSQAARLEHLPQLRVTTPAAPGGFAVHFPLHFVDRVSTSAWVQLRLQVLSGRVGLAVLNSKGEIVTRSTASLLQTAKPVDVSLKVPELSRGAAFVIFNENLAAASQIEILDAAIVVSQEDAARYKEILAALSNPQSLVESEVQPPADSVRLDEPIKLSEVEAGHTTARIERLPQLRVTTPALPGGFAATFRIHGADKISTVSWVQLRIKVISGMVGLAVNNQKTGIVVRTTKPLPPSAEPVDVALKVPQISRGDTFVLFNENGAAASRVEILDISVRVPRK